MPRKNNMNKQLTALTTAFVNQLVTFTRDTIADEITHQAMAAAKAPKAPKAAKPKADKAPETTDTAIKVVRRGRPRKNPIEVTAPKNGQNTPTTL